MKNFTFCFIRNERNIIPVKDIQDAIRCSRSIYFTRLRKGTRIPETSFLVRKVVTIGDDRFKAFIADHGTVTVVTFRGTEG